LVSSGYFAELLKCNCVLSLPLFLLSGRKPALIRHKISNTERTEYGDG